MEPVSKQLTCPGCGQTATVRVMEGAADTQRWQCPHCKKIQTSDKTAVDSAPQAG
jgi:transposase-like protein